MVQCMHVRHVITVMTSLVSLKILLFKSVQTQQAKEHYCSLACHVCMLSNSNIFVLCSRLATIALRHEVLWASWRITPMLAKVVHKVQISECSIATHVATMMRGVVTHCET